MSFVKMCSVLRDNRSVSWKFKYFWVLLMEFSDQKVSLSYIKMFLIACYI